MLDLQSLGFTKEELQDRVVDQICQQVLNGTGWDEDGNEVSRQSEFSRQINEAVRKQISASIDALAQKHVLPNVAQYIENLCLQETTEWGEKKKEPVTFLQYLVARAEAYLQEKVDSNGKGKSEGDSYGWSGKQTRITHLVHQHLAFSIEKAMKDALSIATGEIAKGIHETARLKLNEIAVGLKVSVATK